MFQVCLLDDNRVVRKEVFRSYDAALAFFDANRKAFTCEFRDLKFYSNWRYTAS